MRTKRLELEVDQIGEQGRSLTIEEQLKISDYIQKSKLKRQLETARKHVTV